MANLSPIFLSSYESISKHMEIYEQKLIQKEGEFQEINLSFALVNSSSLIAPDLKRLFNFSISSEILI